MAIMRRCPSDRALIELFMSGAADPRMEKVLDRLASCPRCGSRFEVLRELHRELEPRIREFLGDFGDKEGDAGAALAAAAERKLAELRQARAAAPPRPAPALLPARRKSAFTAALFILVLGVTGVFLSRTVLRPRAEMRSPGFELKLLSPIGRIDEIPTLFKWTPVRHAENYTISLTDSSLREIHKAGTYLVTEAVIPPEVRSSLHEAETYIWKVRAVDGDSNVLVERSAYFIVE
jgi:hypothetical protein